MEAAFSLEPMDDSRSKLESTRNLQKTRSGSYAQMQCIQDLGNIVKLIENPGKNKDDPSVILNKLKDMYRAKLGTQQKQKLLNVTKRYFLTLSHQAMEANKKAINTIIAEVSTVPETQRYGKTFREMPLKKQNLANAQELVALIKTGKEKIIYDIAYACHWYTDTQSLLFTLRNIIRSSQDDKEKQQLFRLAIVILETLNPQTLNPKYSPFFRSIAGLSISSQNPALTIYGDQILERLRKLNDAQTGWGIPEGQNGDVINENSPPEQAQNETKDLDPFTQPNDWFKHQKSSILKGEYTDRDISAVAHDLKKMGMNFFSKIPPEELSRQKWTKDKASATHIIDFINEFNNISAFIVHEILSINSKHERAHFISFMIQVAQKSNAIYDQNSCFAVIAGLNMQFIGRLKQSWSLVSEENRKLFDELNELYTPLHNFANLRAVIKKEENSNHHLLPAFNVWIKDLVFADDGNPTRVDGKININKLEILGKLQTDISNLQKLCKTSTCFATDICTYIIPREMNEEKLHTLSLHLESSQHHIDNKMDG